MEMEYSKFMEKTNAVLAHLEVVDVGAIAPAIQSAITAGQVEGLTPKQYGQFGQVFEHCVRHSQKRFHQLVTALRQVFRVSNSPMLLLWNKQSRMLLWLLVILTL